MSASVFRDVQLVCDTCGCGSPWLSELIRRDRSRPVTALRRYMAGQGWKTGVRAPGDPRLADFCPGHAGQQAPS